MSEISQPVDGSAAADGTPVPSPAPNAGTVEPVVPAGYVPQSELEKARQTISGLQSTKDKLQAALDAASKPAPADGSTTPATPDVGALVESAVSRVFAANAIATEAAALRTEFPHADPALFAPERLSGFQSPDALRSRVEADHARVVAILEADRAARDGKSREELAAAAGGIAGSQGGGTPPAGDPTPQQLAEMSFAELDALETSSPGVLDRVRAGLRLAS